MDTQKLFTRVEIKAVDTSQRLITGYAAAFMNRDRTGDVIEPKAFDRSLKENQDVVAFIGHDSSKLPIGEPIEMHADANGLHTTTSIYQTADGDALLEVAKRRMSRGKSLGMSIGYRSRKDRYVEGARHLLDVDLVEYSFLASPDFAANPLATVTGLKASSKAAGLGQVITTEDSYEDLIDDIEDAATLLLGGYMVSVCATFSDHAIVCAYGMPASVGTALGSDDVDEMSYWDIPYTLDDNHEPVLGDPTPVDQAFVPADAKGRAAAMHSTKATPSSGYDPNDNSVGASGRSDFAYVDSNGRGHLPIHDASHVRAAMSRFDQTQFESDDKKKAAARKIIARAHSFNIEVSPDSAVAKAAGDGGGTMWDDAFVAALPDSAFAHIEGDGHAVKDDTGRTVPRDHRHYPHHNLDGSLNETQLAHMLQHAAHSDKDAGAKSLGHLEQHAFAAAMLNDVDAHDPNYAEGAAATLMSVGYKLGEIIRDIAADRAAMERMGLDTKKGARLNSNMRVRLKDLHTSLSQILEWAEAIEKGDDGKMRVDMFRHRLALLELETV